MGTEAIKLEIKEENLAKIAITKEADRAVSELVIRVNDGFEAGKASKQDITSYAILRFCKACVDADIHAIRELFFNPILLMEATLRRAKETGVIPDSLRDLLFQQFVSARGIAQHAKKSKNSLKKNVIIDNVDGDEGAA